MTAFNISLLLSGPYHDMLVAGLGLSIRLLGWTLLLALPLALGIALLRLAPHRALSAFGWVYVESIRNVPLLAHLLFWYFGAPELLRCDDSGARDRCTGFWRTQVRDAQGKKPVVHKKPGLLLLRLCIYRKHKKKTGKNFCAPVQMFG